MTIKELKQKYLRFFEEKGHKVIPGASLIPEIDPTVLFTTAGMHPLTPYLLGEKHPGGKKLVNVQKCIRTRDIEEVGDDVHLTFFEMLGNWSLGDYWKKEAIEMSFEFLTKELSLPVEKLAISCFKGDKDAVKDEESAKIWQSLGIPKDRIYFFGKEDNWWGPAGKIGPCGPDTEIFYWVGKGKPPKLITSDNKEGWVEIWNDVFMEYNKTEKGTYEPLKQKNVDTGMGVERTAVILSGKESVYDIEPLKSIVEKIRELMGENYVKGERIIADHLRASVFILADGVIPSNVEQGYVLRRLIRRAVFYGKNLGIEKAFTHEIGELAIKLMGGEHSELEENKDFIIEQLVNEEEKFNKSLERGLKKFSKKLSPLFTKEEYENEKITRFPSKEKITGYWLFDQYQELGLPKELSIEELRARGYDFSKSDLEKIDKEFREALKKHQKLSRTATAGKFKSGLADHSEEVTKLHTATHLLLAALRKVLGEHVVQKGSNITGERLRLDFSHSEKLTDEQLKKVEDLVNEQIKKNLLVSCCEISLDEAKKMGAMGVFETKYGDKVKVYTVGDSKKPFSCEVCAGPHIKSTAELGHFKIKKEESSSAGIRRIKAVLE